MSKYLAEMLGTMVLIILGDGVVANVLLDKTKGQNSGWIVITTGWGLGVTIAVFIFGPISGAHINPAVTLGLATIGKFPWSSVPGYIAAQLIGGFLGALIVWLFYKNHFNEGDNQSEKLAVFCTGPAINDTSSNFFSEFIGTFLLVFASLGLNNTPMVNELAPVASGLIVWSIGISLGGTTGYAINPARDFGPRLAHYIVPIRGKGDSEWRYAWIPVIGPVIGGMTAAVVFNLNYSYL